MHRRITFRKMESSPIIEEHANKLIDKLMILLAKEPTPIYIDLILEPSKIHAHNKVDLLLKTPNYSLVSSYEGPDIYDVLNRVFHVMNQKLKKHKGIKADKVYSPNNRKL